MKLMADGAWGKDWSDDWGDNGIWKSSERGTWKPILDDRVSDVISEKERAEEILNELEDDEGVWREFNLLLRKRKLDKLKKKNDTTP